MLTTQQDKITVYTDGSCMPNPGPGGYGFIFIDPVSNTEWLVNGGELNTTNNRMEMLAAIEALKQLKTPCKVSLYTDSKYLQQGATSWMQKWKLNNWRRGNIMIKNDDLWKELSYQMEKHQIEFHWVKGHSNNVENNLVDELARKACEKFMN